jgi:hypothetical protein
MNLGGPEFVVALTVGVLPLVSLVVTIVALVDVLARRDWVWQQAGESRALWLALLIIGLPLCLIGLISGMIYLFTVRPRLDAVQQVQGATGPYLGQPGSPLYPPGSTPPVGPQWAPPPPPPPPPGDTGRAGPERPAERPDSAADE